MDRLWFTSKTQPRFSLIRPPLSHARQPPPHVDMAHTRPSRGAENHIRLHGYGDGSGFRMCSGQHVPMLVLLQSNPGEASNRQEHICGRRLISWLCYSIGLPWISLPTSLKPEHQYSVSVCKDD
ncbi:hypothetical protein BS78_04G277500 [Paspalum vaginatum]|nr:hypothetical protein BS78_04G277500 [Paspalum vaginatum]